MCIFDISLVFESWYSRIIFGEIQFRKKNVNEFDGKWPKILGRKVKRKYRSYPVHY